MASVAAIRVEGFKQARAALRGIDKGLPRELTKGLKEGARIAAVRASKTARKGKTGRLSNRMRPGASGSRAYIKNSLIYAGVQEFGGRVGRKHATRIIGSHAMENAIEETTDEVLEKIADEIDALAVRNGFS